MRHKDKGLTLVEVLVVVVILSILVASLYIVFKSAVDVWTKSKARLDIIQNARVILDQLSRELPGAFVDSTVFADFVGANNTGYGGSDKLEFVTFFAGKIYNIKYERIPGDILRRQYDENPDYTTIAYTDINFGLMVNNIQFYYLEVLDPPASPVPPAASTDWGPPPLPGKRRNSWDSTAATADPVTENKLPEAVKIQLQLIDNDFTTFDFETIVYLPNSTAN